MGDPIKQRKEIFKYLKDNKLYEGDSFEHFEQDFSSADGQKKLYDFLSKAELVTVPFEDFAVGYYSDVNSKRVAEKKKEEQTPKIQPQPTEVGDGGLGTTSPEPLPQKEQLMPPEQAAGFLLNNPDTKKLEWETIIQGFKSGPLDKSAIDAKRKDIDDRKQFELNIIDERYQKGDIKDDKTYEALKKQTENKFAKEHLTLDKDLKLDKLLWDSGVVSPSHEAFKALSKIELPNGFDDKNKDPEWEKIKLNAVEIAKKHIDEVLIKEKIVPLTEEQLNAYGEGMRKRGKVISGGGRRPLTDQEVQSLKDQKRKQEEQAAFYGRDENRFTWVDDYDQRAVELTIKDMNLGDKTQESALRTYLTQTVANLKKTERIDSKMDQTLSRLGMPSPKEFEKDFNVVQEVQDNLNKNVAAYKAKFEAQGAVIDKEYQKKATQWSDLKKAELESIYKEYQGAVDRGEINPEMANAEIEKVQKQMKDEYDAMYQDYVKNRSAIQSTNVGEYANLDKIKQEAEKKTAELVKKYGLKDGKFPADYIKKYQTVLESVWNEEGIVNKAEKDAAWRKLSLLGKVNVSLTGGGLNLMEAVFGGWKYFAPGSTTPDYLLNKIDVAREGLPSKDSGEFTMSQLLDGDWWIKNLGEQLPIMAPLMATGGLGFSAGSGLGGLVGMTKTGRQIVGSIVGGGASRFVESNMEANITFVNAFRNGDSYEEAMNKFQEVRNSNYMLMATDAIQTYFIFAKGAKIVASKNNSIIPKGLRTTFGYGNKMGVQVVTEGGEEVAQEFFQEKAENPYLTFGQFANSPVGKEIFWIGGMAGLATSTFMGGLKDRSTIGTVNNMVQDYFSSMENNNISLSDVENRLIQLTQTIDMLESQRQLTPKEIDDARSKLEHSYKMFKQVFDGTLPFAYNSSQFNEYSSLVWEHEQLRKKAEELDKKIPNEDTAVEKDLLKVQMGKIDSRIMDLVKNPESSGYSFNGVSLTPEEFESLVFDNANSDALSQGIAETDDTEMLAKMRAANIQPQAYIANAEEALKAYKEITPEVVDNAIDLAEKDFKIAKEEAEANKNSINFPELLKKQRIAEQKFEDLKYYKAQMEPVESVQFGIQKVGLAEEKTATISDNININEVNKEEISIKQKETEAKIKNKEIFEGVGEFSTELGNSDQAAVPIAHDEKNGVEFVQYAHPETGSVDVIVAGISQNDFVGYYRVYENSKPTNKWSSKFENQSRNKENFKTMISGVQNMLPKGHEYTETTSISTDGLRVWNQQLERGYELQYDKEGRLITTEVAINGDSIINDLGIPVNRGNFENIRVTNNIDFNKVRDIILPYLEKFGLGVEDIYWVNGTVMINLPILKKSENNASENTANDSNKLHTSPLTEEIESSTSVKEGTLKDTPIDSKKDLERGYRVKEGIKYNRQLPIPEENKVSGENTKIIFSPKDKVDATYTVMEAEDVQQSHLNGESNPQFFLGEAQPKGREEGEFMAKTGTIKAQNLDPEQLGLGNIAYFGAPIVNERGEVIQGNGRTEGVKIAYSQYAGKAKEYKEYIKNNAAKFGLNPEELQRFKSPVLVRMVKADDAKAIRLGQFTTSDLEDIGGKKAEAKGRIRRLNPEQIKRISDKLLAVTDEESTLRSAIRSAGIDLMRIMRDVGAISEQDYSDGISNSTVKTELVDKAANFFRQLALEGGISELSTELDRLPHAIIDGFERGIVALLSVDPKSDLLPDLHMAILGVGEYREAKKSQGVGYSFRQWAESPTLFSGAPNERYSPTQLALIEALEDKFSKAKEISNFFQEYQKITKIPEKDLFSETIAPIEALSKAEALNKLLGSNIDTNDIKETGRTGPVVGQTNESETGESGGKIGESGQLTGGKYGEDTKIGQQKIKQPIEAGSELPTIENEAEAEGPIVDNSFIGIDNAPAYFEAYYETTGDPDLARRLTLDLLSNSPLTQESIDMVDEILEGMVDQINIKKGISMDATEIAEEVIDTEDPIKIEELAVQNDKLLDEAILPESLNNEILSEMLKAGIIDKEIYFRANEYLKEGDVASKLFYDEALANLDKLVQASKTSKKETAKKKSPVKKTAPKTEGPKTVKEKKSSLQSNLDKSKKELSDLLKKLKGDSGEQLAGDVRPIDIVRAGAKYGYYAIEKFAETYAANPEKINKTTWKQHMSELFGADIDPYLDAMWDIRVMDDIDPNSPRISEHAENVRNRIKSQLASSQLLGVIPEGKQGKPKVDLVAEGERPAISYSNYELLPASVEEFIPESEYGTDLDKHQRYTVNMALTNFISNKQRGFLLNDSMGVGKTRQMLAMAKAYNQRTGDPVLIVTESKQIIETSFGPDALAMGIDLAEIGTRIITYSQLKNETKNDFGLVIYDEAHNLKNPNNAFDASGLITSNHVLHSTATPGDKIGSAIYFLSDLIGISREELMGELGIKKGSKGWEMRGGKSELEAVQKIDEYIQDFIKEGKIIRKEYPYWGKSQEVIIPLDPIQEEEVTNVRIAFDTMIDQVRPGIYYDQKTGEMKSTPGRRSWDKDYNGLTEAGKDAKDDEVLRGLREQKINMLDKLVETYKAKMISMMIQKDIAAGKAIVVPSKYVNEIKVKGIDGNASTEVTRESFLQSLKSELDSKGIAYVEVTGKSEKVESVNSFQNGEVNVILGSLSSMAAGINLDDTVGDRPRVLYLPFASYDANEFNQVQGRVSRRNSKTEAYTYIVYGNTDSEISKQGKVTKKTGMLGVFQGKGLDEETKAELEKVDNYKNNIPDEKKVPYIEDISDKAFVVKDSFDMKSILKSVNAKWNGKSKGWMFPAGRKQEIQELIDKWNAGELDLPYAEQLLENYQFSTSPSAYSGKQMQNASNKSTGDANVERITIAPIKGGTPKQLDDIFKEMRKSLKVAIKYGMQGVTSKKALGIYRAINSLIQVKFKKDFDTIIHEIGHYFDDKFKIAPQDGSMDEELRQYWNFGSAPKASDPNPQKYRRAEGVAEFIRAMVVNPGAAKSQSPGLWDLVMAKLPEDVRTAMFSFSEDLRIAHGLDAGGMMRATMRETKRDKAARMTRKEKRKEWWDNAMDRYGFKNVKGSEWYMNWFDRISTDWTDKLFPVKKSFKELQELTDKTDVKLSDNPYIMARMFSGIGGKINNILNLGAVSFNKKEGYSRIIDTVTGQKVTLDWMLQPLMDTLDNTDLSKITLFSFKWLNPSAYQIGKKEKYTERNLAIRDFKNLVGNYMVAQRTLEYADKFATVTVDPETGIETVTKPKDNLTGIGIGISDYDVAEAFLEEFDTMGEDFQAQVKEAARRYRKFADSMLQYMADSGRISQEMVDLIRTNNTQYVAMQRVMELGPGEDLEWANKSGGVLKLEKAKGGAEMRFDPYENLMTNLYKTIEDSDRNSVFNSFVEMMRYPRGMYEGNVTPTSHIGYMTSPPPGMSPSQFGDHNILLVHNNGEKEYWQLNPDVYKALSNLYTNAEPMSQYSASLAGLWRMNADLVRFTVTKNPAFAYLRNLPRDIQARMVQSRTIGKSDTKAYKEALKGLGLSENKMNELTKQLNMTRKEAASDLELYGGSQAGYYTKSREHYYAALDKVIRKEAKKGSIVLDRESLMDAFDNYDNFLSQGEMITRVSEYKTAFKHAKTVLKYDDYDAGVYAAYQARDLMDFAVIGYYMQRINRVIPFSNASLQGTMRMLNGLSEDYQKGAAGKTGANAIASGLLYAAPGASLAIDGTTNTMTRWTMFQVAPAMFFFAMARALGYEDEYDDQQAHMKDMFYSFKIPSISSDWIRIPKPFELGVGASGVERLITAISKGQTLEKAFQGYSGSIARAMLPFHYTDVMGPFKPIIETIFNYSSYYQNSIVPVWEEEKAVELRKGFQERKGSNLGHLIYKMAGIDPRKTDYAIRSWFTYFGDWTMAASDLIPRSMFGDYFKDTEGDVQESGRDIDVARYGMNLLGFFVKSKPTKTRSVQWLMNMMNEFDLRKTPDAKSLQAMVESYSEAKTPEDQNQKMEEIVQYANALEKIWKKKIDAYHRVLKGEKVELDGVIWEKQNVSEMKKDLFNN